MVKASRKGPDGTNVSIYLPVELLERLRVAAEADGRSLSNYLAQLLDRAHPPEGRVHRLKLR